MKIPFSDLVPIHRELESELQAVFLKTCRSAGFVGGAMVEEFEKAFAAWVGTKHCVGVSNGTDALRLALMAMGCQRGDRVLTVANTFIATTEAIHQAGGVLDFVDVEEQTSLLDPKALERLLEDPARRPKFVVPVHLYGQMVDMTRLGALAEKYGFQILEDAAQAHGATQNGKRAGTIGRAAGFSFYPGKNLGALGEGGAVTTNDDEVASRVRMLRDHGQREKYFHVYEGYNARLHSMQAGFLSVKLPHLNGWNERRRAIAQRYDAAFEGKDGIRPVRAYRENVSVAHLYVIHVADPRGLQKQLAEQGIASGFHYPIPIHHQDCYREEAFYRMSLPVTEKLAGQLLSLPIYPHLAEAEVDYVIEKVLAAQGRT